MGRRAWIAGLVLVGMIGVTAGVARAQGDSVREVALELARLSIDDVARRRVDEQVTGSLIRTVSSSLQERLNRRLQDGEWRLLTEIVARFVRETLPPERTNEIAAAVYLRNFDEPELRELLAFQRSAVGRKLARLSPAIAVDTTRAIDAVLRTSAAAPEMLDDLRRAFPILGTVESP